MNSYPINIRNKVKRVPKRGHYDKETVYAILDAAFVCHVSFVIEGQPFIIPTAYGREGNKIYLHGATTSRMLVALQQGIPATLAVTHLDGIVLARSSFHSSMNYRSAIIFGTAKLVEIEDEKLHALKVVSDNIVNGRWDELRPTNSKELKATSVLAIEIETASAKIRSGGPLDEDDDMNIPIWAGVIPLKVATGEIISDPLLDPDIEASDLVKNYHYSS